MSSPFLLERVKGYISEIIKLCDELDLDAEQAVNTLLKETAYHVPIVRANTKIGYCAWMIVLSGQIDERAIGQHLRKTGKYRGLYSAKKYIFGKSNGKNIKSARC